MPNFGIIIEGSQTDAPYAGGRSAISPDAAMAAGRGNVALGRDLQHVANVAGEVASHMLHGKNVAAVADAERQMDEEFANFQLAMAKMTDEETWSPQWQDKAKAVRQSILDRAPSNEAKRILTERTARWEMESGIQVRTQQTKRTVERQKAKITSAAEYMFEQGDYERGASIIDEGEKAGLLFPEQAAELRTKGAGIVSYSAARATFDAALVQPLRDQAESLRTLSADLLHKNEDGTYDSFEYEGRGMTGAQRLEFASQVQARVRAVTREMDGNALALIRGLRNGDATLADVGTAWRQGEIGVDAVAPEFRAALQVGLNKQAQAEEKAARRTEKAALEEMTAGYQDIDAQVLRGELTPARAREIKLRLAATTSVQASLPDYAEISEQLDAWYARKVFLTDPAESARGQPEPREYRALVGMITDPKSPLTQPARLELMQRLFEAKIADVSELEEEKGDKWTWIDRDISRPEAAMRVELIRTYTDLLPDLGEADAGSLLFSQERRIVDFFTDNEKPTPQQIAELRAGLLQEAQALAGSSLLRDSFGN